MSRTSCQVWECQPKRRWLPFEPLKNCTSRRGRAGARLPRLPAGTRSSEWVMDDLPLEDEGAERRWRKRKQDGDAAVETGNEQSCREDDDSAGMAAAQAAQHTAAPPAVPDSDVPPASAADGLARLLSEPCLDAVTSIVGFRDDTAASHEFKRALKFAVMDTLAKAQTLATQPSAGSLVAGEEGVTTFDAMDRERHQQTDVEKARRWFVNDGERDRLEAVYTEHKFPTESAREDLAKELEATPRQVRARRPREYSGTHRAPKARSRARPSARALVRKTHY